MFFLVIGVIVAYSAFGAYLLHRHAGLFPFGHPFYVEASGRAWFYFYSWWNRPAIVMVWPVLIPYTWIRNQLYELDYKTKKERRF